MIPRQLSSFKAFGLVLLLVAVLADGADGRPRRLPRRRAGGDGSVGIKAVAPKGDPDYETYPALQAYFNYDRGMSEEVAFSDRIRVFVMASDEQIVKADDPLTAEVKVTDLSNEPATTVQYFPISWETVAPGQKMGIFDVRNEPGAPAIVEPAKVYRLFVNLHRRSSRYDAETVLGKLAVPYYVATADATRINRARRHIAMRTFKEFYYVQQGWPSEERYPMDCYAYYTWAAGSCTVGAWNGHAILDRLFGGRRPFQSGGAIASLAQNEPIHGDYVRMPGHSFMLLAYSPNSGHVWTMEGNFNSSIEIVQRTIDPGWTVGHLHDEHVQPELFQVSQTEATPGVVTSGAVTQAAATEPVSGPSS
jgi:hypothetical protein